LIDWLIDWLIDLEQVHVLISTETQNL
jgi:hypothetical protein